MVLGSFQLLYWDWNPHASNWLSIRFMLRAAFAENLGFNTVQDIVRREKYITRLVELDFIDGLSAQVPSKILKGTVTSVRTSYNIMSSNFEVRIRTLEHKHRGLTNHVMCPGYQDFSGCVPGIDVIFCFTLRVPMLSSLSGTEVECLSLCVRFSPQLHDWGNMKVIFKLDSKISYFRQPLITCCCNSSNTYYRSDQATIILYTLSHSIVSCGHQSFWVQCTTHVQNSVNRLDLPKVHHCTRCDCNLWPHDHLMSWRIRSVQLPSHTSGARCKWVVNCVDAWVTLPISFESGHCGNKIYLQVWVWSIPACLAWDQSDTLYLSLFITVEMSRNAWMICYEHLAVLPFKVNRRAPVSQYTVNRCWSYQCLTADSCRIFWPVCSHDGFSIE